MTAPLEPVDPTPIDPRQLRVSNADRERIAARLQQASADGRLGLDELDERLGAAYAAQTYADLEPLTRDLPAVAEAEPMPAGTGLRPTSRWAVAVMGGFTRKGTWVVPRRFLCLTFCGGGQIDLREARFADGEVTIRVFALMGGVEITVPPETHVNATGIGIMGGWDEPSDGATTPGGPRVTVTGLAVMGGVSVKRRRRKRKRLKDEDDD